MKTFDSENVIKHIEAAYKEYGLQDFSVFVDRLANRQDTYSIAITNVTELQGVRMPSEIIENLQSVMLNIENSKYVQGLKKCHSEEKGALRDIIKELEKYETYYNLAKGLK